MVLQRVQGEYAKRPQWTVDVENDMTFDLIIISVGYCIFIHGRLMLDMTKDCNDLLQLMKNFFSFPKCCL